MHFPCAETMEIALYSCVRSPRPSDYNVISSLPPRITMFRVSPLESAFCNIVMRGEGGNSNDLCGRREKAHGFRCVFKRITAHRCNYLYDISWKSTLEIIDPLPVVVFEQKCVFEEKPPSGESFMGGFLKRNRLVARLLWALF